MPSTNGRFLNYHEISFLKAGYGLTVIDSLKMFLIDLRWGRLVSLNFLDSGIKVKQDGAPSINWFLKYAASSFLFSRVRR